MNSQIEQIKKIIKKKYQDCILESDDKKECRKILKTLNVPEDSFFFFYYSNYDAGEIYADERNDDRAFYEMLYCTDLEDESKYLKDKFRMPSHLIPITSTEGDGCVFYNFKTGEVADVSFDQFTQLEENVFKPQWPTFEAYLIDFLDIK